MTSRNDIREIADYVANLLAAVRPDSAVGRKLGAWIRDHEALLGLDYRGIVEPRAKASAKTRSRPADKPLSAAAWARLAQALSRRVTETVPALLVRNVAALATALRLSKLETSLFALVAMTSYQSPLDTLCEQISETRCWTPEELIGVMLKALPADVGSALSRGALAAMKLIDGVGDRPGRFGLFVHYRIMDALRPPICGLDEIERMLLGAPAESNLVWEDFDYIASERDFAAALLSGAVARSQPGINVLLYGAPGTGKTELAKVIAHRIGSPLYPVGESDEYGDEPSRYDRLAALRLNDRLLQRRGRACLLFDEMEDLLQKGDASYQDGRRVRRAGSKVFFNRLLEQNGVPIIWTANGLDEFDPAFLRRMSFAFEMKTPGRRVRRRLWLRTAEQEGMALDETMAETLAEQHRIPPSLTHSAVHAVAVAGAQAGQLDFVVERLARAAEGARRPRRRAAVPCDLDLLNADRDLARLEQRLSAGPRSLSFCLYGPPGTGKSAYARRLAERMNLDVLEKKASDLLSKWVGETEERIAAVFEEAALDERFLIIDEAESLIWSRAGASRSWEVSMVNEFLTGLENHDYPVACTTNQLAHFDAAALRRFTFKVKFDFLLPDQLETAFERFFSLPAPRSLRQVPSLALGDFAVVKKQLSFRGDRSPAAEEIVALLAAETTAKQQGPQRIGF